MIDILKVKLWLGERWGWVVTAASCVLFFFDMGFLLTFSIVVPSLREEFNSTTTETAWVGSIPFGLAVYSPLINFALELLGHRTVVVAGLSLSGCGLIASSFVRSLGPLFVTYSLAYGLGTGMLMFGSFSLLLHYFPFNNSSRAVVMPMASSNLGMFTLGPLTYYLKTRYGWRNMLRIMGAVILVATVPLSAVTFSDPDRGGTTGKEPDDSTNGRACNTNEKYSKKKKFSKLGHHGYTTYVAEKECCVSERLEGKDTYKNDIKHDDSEKGRFILEACEKKGGDELYHDDIKLEKYVELSGKDKERNRKSLENSRKEEWDEDYVSSRRHRARSLPYRILVALTYPDLLFLACSVLGYGLVNSFVIIQLGSYMLSIGYTEQNGAQALVVMGVSLMVGKVVLVLFADRAPFPKLAFFVIASVFGITSLVFMLLIPNLPVVLIATAVLGVAVMSTADSLPYSICNYIFGVERGTETVAVVGFFHGAGYILASILGESVDGTGTYDMSLYACIGIYALCGLLCVMVPVWQRCFVRDRPVMDVWFGWKREPSSGVTNGESKPSMTSKTEYKIVDLVESLPSLPLSTNYMVVDKLTTV